MTPASVTIPGLISSRDEAAFNLLREAIADKRAVAFVGAGMSARAGFKDWSGLLDQMTAASKLGKQEKHGSQQRPATDSGLLKDFSWRAEEIRELIPDDASYFRILESFFNGEGSRDRAIDAFAALRFQHVFTTNYDLSIEAAMRRHRAKKRPALRTANWLAPGQPSEVMRSFGDSARGASYLVYLHGRADAPNTIVLSERDYRAQYVRSDETVRRLFAVFSMRQVAFFGFSLDDLDVLSIFRQVRASNEKATHFALLADDAPADRERIRARFVNKYGIHPIFYDNPEKDYRKLTPLIEELGRSRTPSQKRRVTRPGSVYRGPKWTTTAAFRTLRKKADPEDPQKGRFHGSPRCNGRELRAKVDPDRNARGWFDLEIEVVATNRRPVTGRVDLWVHDSFTQEHYYTNAANGRAKFTFSAYGAFTAGAVVDDGRTPLELDLSELPDAPKQFVLG